MGREDVKELGIRRPGTLALVMKAIKVLQMKSQCSPIFIDHDPYCFGKILDQLRLKVMSKEEYKPLPLICIREAKQDAFVKTVDYYFPGELAKLIFKECVVVDSNIVFEDEVDIIQGWLDEGGCRSIRKLLYRASSDGWSSSEFHDNCDDKGPTLTIIQSTGGYVFGGFCDTAWSSDERDKTSPKAFLFTLKCHSGLPPTKMRLRDINDEKAVGVDNDLSYCFTDEGSTYECPEGQTGGFFLTGSDTFRASDIE
eukprot:10630243-Ditylum_brightwellii.AAC.1